ncbi:hypothetical protein [Paramagnetospirillum marisnigri]|nr:hypothetical protein [Paramagnetospirillum marisnigri]
MARRVHTKIGPALRDWTTWVSVTIGGAMAALSPLLDDPWSRRLQIGAVLVGLLGTLIKGPQPKESDHADAA